MKKKLLFLFSMMALLFAPFTLWAQDPEPDTEYEAALAAIGDGGNYFISTDVEGTKYYITADGKLTNTRANGCIFAFTKVEGNGYRQYGYYIDGGNRFTNANLSSDKAVLNISNYSTSTNNRNTWEAQVLFLKDGKYAIRATNAAYGESSWADAGRVFFSWKVEDVAIPQYTYDQVYLWEFEAVTPITVTYKLVESDGVTEVSSVAQKQEANSEVNIPSSLVNNFIYDYAASGTVGGEDCVITVTRTFKSGMVHALTDLSNAKAYTIRCDRGAFLTKDGHLASTAHGSLKAAEATNFAIINFEDKYYLFSVADGKFVLKDGALADEVDDTEDAVIMDAKTDPYFLYYFKINGTNNGLNTNGNDPYGYVINTWMTADAGNQYYMIEAADFDASSALATLQDCLHPVVYTITCAEAENGTVVANKEETRAGKTVKLTVTPEVGFELDALTVKAGDVEVAVTEDFTFVMPAGAVTVTATFKQFEGIPDGKYFVLNNASGLYLGAGNSWGTQASLLPHPEYVTFLVNENATYKLESQVNNGGTQYYFNGDFMDNGNPVELTLTKQLDGTFTIRTGSNYFGYDGSTTVLGKNLAADSENALWTIIPYDEAKANLANATIDQPIDATLLIEDHDFGRNNRNVGKWIVSEDCTNKNLSGGNNTNNCAESYHSVFTISQALTEVPNGVYALTAQGFYRQDGEDNEHLPVFFANDETAAFPLKTGTENSMSDASGSFSAGQYTINPIWVKVTDGTLNIGVKLAGNTALWCIWDNFVLTYYGDVDIADAKAAGTMADYAEVVDEYMEATVAEALKGAKATFDADKSDANLSALAEAVAVAKASVEAYAGAKVKLAAMKGLIDKTNFYSEEAYAAYYGDAKAKYDAATLTTAEANALQDPSVVTGWHAAITVDNFLLSVWDTNPDFEDAPYYINTWSVEGENDGTEFKVPFFEYWTGDDNSLAEKTLTATIEGLEAGKTALVNIWVRVRAKNGTTAADATGITLQVNDGEAVDVTEGETNGQFNLAKYTAKGVIGEDGKLVVKFNVAADNNISWLSFKDAQFQAVDDEEVPYVMALTAIEDGANYCITTMVGEDKYYLTADGTLTSDINEAGTFVFEKASQDGNPYEYGFLLNSQNNTRFSNPYSPSEEYLTNGSLNTTTNNRSDWEAQVFFMKDGKFAVRSTNAPSGDEGSWGWIGSAYWTVNQGEAGPLAEYSWDPNYVWNLEKNTLVELQYVLAFNGDTYTAKAVQPIGFKPIASSEFVNATHGMYNLIPDVEAITAETATVNFSAEWAGIFDFSTDFDNAKWMNMDIRSGWVVSKCEAEPYTMNDNVAKVDLLKAEYQWAFLPVEGEPFQMTIINAAAQGQSLAKVTPEEGDSYVALRDGIFKWEFFANNDGFVIRPVDGEGNENMWVNQSGGASPTNPLSFWNSANGKTDNGSTFRVSEAPDATEAYLELLKASLAANEPNPVLAGAAVFQKPQAAYDTFKAAYDAQAAVAAKEDATLEEVQAAITALDAAVTTYDAVEVNKPEAGQLYMFQNKVNGGYMALVVDGENVEVRAIAGSQGFEFSETEGGYFIKNEIGSVGLVGNKLGGVEEPNMAIEAIPAELTEDGVLYYNIINLADGRAINGNKNLDKSCSFITTPKDNASWTIVKYEYVPVCLKSYDLALRDIAVSDWTTVTIADAEIINEAAGLLGAAPAELTYQLVDTLGVRTDYNGNPGEILFWVDYDGNKSNWGVNNKYYILYDAATPAITITQFGAEYGKTLKAVVRLANAAGDYVEFKLSETMADAPATKFLADYTKKGTVEVVLVPAAEGAYDAVLSQDYNESEVSALIGADWGAIYGVGAKVDGQETLTDAYSCTPNPGFWCLADGTADVWANGAFGVSLIADENWTTFHFSAWTKEAVTTPMTTTFYLVNEATKEYVAYVITLSVYDSIRDMQLDGKAEIYDLNGRKVSKIQRGGIYIVNGKRVAVK